ncbi:MAG: flagellar hook protein FlgE [Rhodospirillales bacterium]
MSLFGAMSTAISGLSAQSAAFTNISDNTANSQTIGYKGVNTSFIDYLTASSATSNQSGSVVTRPDYTNEVQGSIDQSGDPLAMAINGQGLFAVSQQNGTTGTGVPTFQAQQSYTRAGDFQLDKNGYMVNSAGQTLDGWSINPATGTLNTSKLVPIQVNQGKLAPVPTANVSLVANVPSTPTASSILSSSVQVYDATGNTHQLDTTWAQTGTNSWTLSLSSPDNQPSAAIGTVNVAFNSNGTLASLSGATGAVAVGGSASAAAVTLAPTFGGAAQNISLNLGNFNTASGVTQYAGTDYNLENTSQDGAGAGSFTGVSTASTGVVSANYDNGQSVAIAQVPVITFADADALQSQSGQSFTATADSGVAIAQSQNQNGAGGLVIGSTEASNVDIATELSKLIVAQQAYGANAKVIATANQLLQTTMEIKQ